jgi:hypothetical protein
MTALNTEFEQKFIKVLRSRVAAVPRGVMGALDPHPNRRLEQDGRSPPCCHRRDLSPDTERLSRRPGRLWQQLEPHHSAQPSPGTTASAHSENGPGQPLADTVRRGEDHVPAIVRGSYRSVYHRCSHGGPGVDPGSLGRPSAGNTARLAPLPARPANSGPARSQGLLTDPFPYRPCAGLPHRNGGLERASMSEGPTNGWTSHHGGNSPTPGLALRPMWCGVGLYPNYHPCQPHNRATPARGTLWSITCHQDYLSGEDRIPCPPKTLAVAPSP